MAACSEAAPSLRLFFAGACRLWSAPRVNYSVYLPAERYVEPIIKKEQQPDLTDSSNERKFRVVKPATINEYSSSGYDATVEKFMNMMMKEGKKAVVRNYMRKTMENIKLVQVEKYNKASPEERARIQINPVSILHAAYENCKPTVRLVRTVRAGVVYQVPVACDERHQRFMSMKWLIESAKDKTENVRIDEALARELLDASKNEGRSIRKKHDLHKQCEANRAYAHFRWQ